MLVLRNGALVFFYLSLLYCASIISAKTTPRKNAIRVRPDVHSVLLNESVPEALRNLPLVAKCCPVGEVIVKDASGKALCRRQNAINHKTSPRSGSNKNNIEDDYDDNNNNNNDDDDDDDDYVFSPLFSPFNTTGLLAPGDERVAFMAVVGDPCRYKRYMLRPEETSDDEYYLMLNGSVFAPRHVPVMLNPRHDYCMEVIPGLVGTRVLVCFPEDNGVVMPADTRITFYASGLLISVPFLLLTIVAYSITPRLRDVHGKALCHYCACLALAFTALAVVQLGSAEIADEFCIAIAFVIQFGFVSCFFWLNVMCIETYCLVRRHVDRKGTRGVDENRLFFFYSLWAWGPSVVLILLSLVMDLSPMIPLTYLKPNFGERSCWFQSDEEAMVYFYLPVGLLVLANLVLFGLTAMKITEYQRDLDLRRLARNQESDRQEQRLFRRLKRTFGVCLVLFFLMGMNWAMEIISWWAGGDPLNWSAFDLVNALQGVLVFGLFVLRKPARDLVWYQILKLAGRDAIEPRIGAMQFHLLPVSIQDDSLPRQRVT